MGQTGSNLTKRIFSPFRSSSKHPVNQTKHNSNPEGLSLVPYIFTRRGSMFFDEDGDLAHEFYEEVKTSNGTKMRKKPQEKLKPQGFVELPIPRLNSNSPVILCEVRSR